MKRFLPFAAITLCFTLGLIVSCTKTDDGDPTGNPRDGHITGSLNIPYPDMIDSTNSFKPVSVLEKNFTSIVPDRNKEVVLYCFIGQTACVDYVVGRNLGYNMKVYEGSMQEWSRDAKMPMEKTKRD